MGLKRTIKIIKCIAAFFFVSLTLNAQESNNLPIETLKRGAYKNMSEFIANEPSITDSFYVDSVERTDFVWRETYSLVPRYSDSNKKLKNIWGFCDGTNTYIFHQLDFFLLENKGDDYTFVGFELVINDGEATAVVIGGIVGGLAGGALSGLGYTNEMKHEARKKKVRYTLKKSGQIIHPYIFIPFKRFQTGYRINIYRNAKNEIEKPILISVNENIVYSFTPNSYQSFFFDSTKTSVKICFGETLEDCITVNLKKDEGNYVQCSLIKKNKNAEVTEVYFEKGKYDSFKPEKAQMKRDFEAFVATPNSNIEKRVEIIFYRESKNEMDNEIEVLLNDSLNFSFVKNSYRLIQVKTFKPNINICYGNGLEDCKAIEIKDGDRLYIECSQLKDNELITVNKVNAKRGKYDSIKPEKAQRKRDKLTENNTQ